MIDVSKLTKEERKELKAKLEAEEVSKVEIEKRRRQEYKDLVDDVVLKNIKKIAYMSSVMSNGKREVQEEFETILALKAALYGIRENQQTHTFTTSDGKYSICIGHRVVDSFDDTVHTGIEKAKNYITRVVKSENEELRQIIDLLLKKDKNGNLKASRVIELEKIALEIKDDELTEAVNIIKEAYRPMKTNTFIEGYYKDKSGNKVNIPLTITGVTGDIEDEIIKGANKEDTCTES